PRLEILVTGLAQGPLHAWKSDGTPAPGWPVLDPPGAAYPALGQLSLTDPGLEVFSGHLASPSRLGAHSGSGAALPGWPRNSANYIASPPSLASIDGSGLDAIFIEEEDWKLHGYRADGTTLPGWPATTFVGGQERHTPAIADLDGDGIPEIIMQTNDAVNVWKGDGSVFPGWPVQLGSYLWLGNAGPVVGDVDGDGQPDIVVLAIQNSGNGGDVLVFHANGTLLPGFPIHLAGLGSGAVPAIADIDLDGRNDIIVASDFWNGVS